MKSWSKWGYVRKNTLRYGHVDEVGFHWLPQHKFVNKNCSDCSPRGLYPHCTPYRLKQREKNRSFRLITIIFFPANQISFSTLSERCFSYFIGEIVGNVWRGRYKSARVADSDVIWRRLGDLSAVFVTMCFYRVWSGQLQRYGEELWDMPRSSR